MVKYQFTSQDAEQWTNQLDRLQEIIEKQARTIEKLENNNNDLRLQIEKLSLQLEKKQGKYQNDSDLLEIKDGKQDQDGSIIQQQKIENVFVQNSTSLFPVHIEKTIYPQSTNIFNQQQQLFKINNIKENSEISSKNEQQQGQFMVNDQFIREQKQSQSNGSSNNSSLIQNNIQQNHNKSNPFAVDDSTQSHNIFDQSKKNDLLQKQSNFLQINQPPENKKEEMILEEQEEEQEEALMFGDPSSIFYNNTLADKSKLNKVQDVEELIKDLQISENQKENSQQNIKDASSKSSDSAKLNQSGEDFQFEENNEEQI